MLRRHSHGPSSAVAWTALALAALAPLATAQVERLPAPARVPERGADVAEPPQQVEAASAVRRGQTGFGARDGSLWAIGDGYRAEFAPGQVEFTPLFGAEAPQNFPVRFALDSIRVATPRSSRQPRESRRGATTRRPSTRTRRRRTVSFWSATRCGPTGSNSACGSSGRC